MQSNTCKFSYFCVESSLEYLKVMLLYSFHNQMVKHFIVHQGSSDDPDPKDIYFVEEKITGGFVKFFGNLNFTISKGNKNKLIYQMMHALAHKTYHDNGGSWMIADIQGNEDGLLTDIAIIDAE